MKYVVENYGNSELGKRYGVTRYPAVFVNDVLVAKPKDFGFYGKGEGVDNGRYTPWKDPASHEKFKTDLKRMIDLVLAGDQEVLRKERESESTESAEIGKLPSFKITDLAGKSLSEKDLEGRLVLVEFWATWCPPCRGTLNWLGQLQKQYGDRLAVLAIAIESDENDVRKVAEDLKLSILWSMGSAEMVRDFGDITSVPTLFLFDQKGSTVRIFYGAPPELHADAERALAQIVQNREDR